MKLEHVIKYISALSAIVMVLLILLIFNTILQFIIPQMTLRETQQVESSSESPEPELTETEKRQLRISNARKEILYDGSIHLVSKISTYISGKNIYETYIRDVNDRVLWSDKGKEEDLPYKYLSWPMSNTLYYDTRTITRQMITPFFSDTFVIPVVPSKGAITEYWRYNSGKRYFIGFDLKRRKIGYAGSNGVKKFKNEVQPFEEAKYINMWLSKSSYTPILLWLTNNWLYKINFQERSVDVVFDAQDQVIDKVWMVNWVDAKRRYDHTDYTEYRPALYICTKNGRHHLLLRDPNEHLILKIPEEWDSDRIRIAPTKNKIFLKYSYREGWPVPSNAQSKMKWWENYRYKSHKQRLEVYQVNPSGNLEPINRFEWIHPADQKPTSNEPTSQEKLYHRQQKMRYYLRTASPPIYDLVWRWYYKDRADSYLSEFKGFNNLIVMGIINVDYYINKYHYPFTSQHYLTNRPINWVVSLLMVCVAFWHGFSRRTCWGKFIFWLVFVGLFNLAGLLTYLALNHTTVIKCSACGRRRGLEKLDCVRCGAELPLPQRRELDLLFKT